ncbi:hypothetical protein FRC09_009976, partial [Ceratobasidium sp. 395]
MFIKLKQAFRRLQQFLIRPFRGRSRGHDRVQSAFLEPMEWDGLDLLTTSLGLAAGAPQLLAAGITDLRVYIEALDARARTREEYGGLRIDLNDLFRNLSGYLDAIVSSSGGQRRVENLARCLNSGVEVLRLQQENGTGADEGIREDLGEILQTS